MSDVRLEQIVVSGEGSLYGLDESGTVWELIFSNGRWRKLPMAKAEGEE